MPSGGPRKPAKPAPVSGPGRMSQRTDGGPGQKARDIPDAAYGEQSAFQAAQSGAALSLAEGALRPSSGGGATMGAPIPVTPFNAPTAYPDMPVTAGAPVGPGFGPEALGLPTERDLQTEDRKALVAYLPVLTFIANQPTAMPSLRAMVRKIKAANGL